MAGDGERPGALRRVPWPVWAAVAATLIVGGVRLSTGGGRRVAVAGAGPIALLRAEDAPDGAFFSLDAAEVEALPASVARVEDAISTWPDVVVFGLDARVVEGGADREAAAREAMARLTRMAENATAVPVVVGLVAPDGARADLAAAVTRHRTWWRRELCAAEGLRLCLDLAPHARDPAAVRAAVATATLDALARHEALRATTQVGR